MVNLFSVLLWSATDIATCRELVDMIFDEFTEVTYLFILECVEVVAALSSGPKLRQVVIKRFLRYTYLISSILKA